MSAETDVKPPAPSPSVTSTSSVAADDKQNVMTSATSNMITSSAATSTNSQIPTSMSAPGATTNSTPSGTALRPQPTVAIVLIKKNYCFCSSYHSVSSFCANNV